MKKALIGFSGFVGGNILSQEKFDDLFDSSNIQEIRGRRYELVVSAGARAEKWWANKNPEEDLAGIKNLISNIEHVKTDHFVLISTVDVYPNPVGVNEKTKIDETRLQPYGGNRLFLEEFVLQNFPKSTIIRFPGLFGRGLKKNLIFDLVHDNHLELFHKDSSYQIYDLESIWKDIEIAVQNNLPLVNFATEPTKVEEIVSYVFGTKFSNVTDKPPVKYDMHTIYGKIFKTNSIYLYFKDHILEKIKNFVQSEIKKPK